MKDIPWHHVYIWEYEVDPKRVDGFLRMYGPEGAWAMLFRRASDYLGTRLLQDRTRPLRYLTIDRWRNAEAREAFLAAFRAEYDELDKACEALTTHEASLGTFLEWSQEGGGQPPHQ